MAIYLVDTSVIIDALNQKRGRWQLLGSLVKAGDTLAVSVVTVMEIYAGMRPHAKHGTPLLDPVIRSPETRLKSKACSTRPIWFLARKLFIINGLVRSLIITVL